MTLDHDLLKKAQDAGSRLVEAERQAQVARGDYHTFVRRLHLAGASLREVAEALDLSHQRVQQIVMSAGGSWWQKVWRSRTIRRDTVCTFCDRPPSEVAKLLAGPNVYICDACVVRAERSVAGGSPVAGDPLVLAKTRAKALCSFCRKPSAKERALLIGVAANICVECLTVCRQILNDRDSSPKPAGG
jgi:hypothetical protein